jgi:hypothetical protein
MEVKVVVHSVEIGARGAVVACVRVIGEVAGDVEQDGFLSGVSLLGWLSKRIVVVAVAVDVVGVDLLKVLLESNREVAASS